MIKAAERRRKALARAGRLEERGELDQLLAFELQISREGVSSYFPGWPNAYDATRQDRLAKPRQRRGGPQDWQLTPLTLWDLREISRDLERNSNLIAGAISTLVANVLHTGFDYTADTGDDGLNKEVDAYLDEWYEIADVREEFHFWDLVEFTERGEIRDGDSFYFLDAAANNGQGGVHVIEGDRCLDPAATREEDVWNGIRRNEYGAPVEYFIVEEAPQGPYERWPDGGDWLPAYKRNNRAAGGVLHCYWPGRYSGTRGAPWFAGCIREVDDIDGILVAERVAMRMSASRATYEQITDPEQYVDAVGDMTFDFPRETWEPGEHGYLPPGAQFGVVEHNRPGDNFQAFLETELRLCGLPSGLPIELILLDFSRPNFSAQRLALQAAHRRFIKRQVSVHRRRVNPVRQFALARAIARGILPDRAEVYETHVIYPLWPYPDPLRDSKADIELNKAGLKSKSEIIVGSGRRPETTFKLLDKEAAEGRGPIPDSPVITVARGEEAERNANQ